MENTKYLITSSAGVPVTASFGGHPSEILKQPPTRQRTCYWPGEARERPSSRSGHRLMLESATMAGFAKAAEFVVEEACPGHDHRDASTTTR